MNSSHPHSHSNPNSNPNATLSLANFASASNTGQFLWSKIPKANSELFALTYGSLIAEILRDLEDPEQVNSQIYAIGKSIGVRCVDEYLARLDAALPSGAVLSFASANVQEYANPNHSGGYKNNNGSNNNSSNSRMNIDDVHSIQPTGAEFQSNSINGGNNNSMTSSFSALPACKSFRDTAESIAKIGFKMFLGVTCDVANFASDGRSFSLYLYEDPLAMFVELPEELSSIKYSNVYCGIICGALEQVNLKVECRFVRDILCGDDVNEIRVELKEIIADGAGEDYQEE